MSAWKLGLGGEGGDNGHDRWCLVTDVHFTGSYLFESQWCILLTMYSWIDAHYRFVLDGCGLLCPLDVDKLL